MSTPAAPKASELREDALSGKVGLTLKFTETGKQFSYRFTRRRGVDEGRVDVFAVGVFDGEKLAYCGVIVPDRG